MILVQHKAGIHAKAILNNPSTYEIIKPEDFGIQRYVHYASRLTGWNAIKSRAEQLNIEMTDAQVKQCTAKVKALADVRSLAVNDVDDIIRDFHRNLKLGEANKPLIGDLTADERRQVAEKEKRALAEVTQVDAEVGGAEQEAKRVKTDGVTA